MGGPIVVIVQDKNVLRVRTSVDASPLPFTDPLQTTPTRARGYAPGVNGHCSTTPDRANTAARRQTLTKSMVPENRSHTNAIFWLLVVMAPCPPVLADATRPPRLIALSQTRVAARGGGAAIASYTRL